MKILYGLAVALSLLIVTTAQTAPSGSSMAFWISLPSEDQQPFLAGAMEMLGGLGLQCPGRIALMDVKNALSKRQKTGKSSPDDRFAAEVLSVHYSLGCTLDKRVLDSLDPALRKKLQ
jgi:hypothetical protein